MKKLRNEERKKRIFCEEIRREKRVVVKYRIKDCYGRKFKR